MSRWVHVTGCLYVETYKEESDIKKCVEEILTDAPKITGSERNADIFVNPLSGHNTWTNCDCEHCEYGKTVVHLEEGGFKCDAEDGYDCPDGEYQTCVAITIIGDLRDRDKDITRNEIEEFIRYIQNIGFNIDYHSVRVVDEWDKSYELCIKYDDNNWEDKGVILWKEI